MGKIICYGDNGPYNLTLSDVRVMTLLAMKDPRTQPEIVNMLRMNPDEVRKSLCKLHKNKLITKKDPKPNTYYATKDQYDIFNGLLLVCWQPNKRA